MPRSGITMTGRRALRTLAAAALVIGPTVLPTAAAAEAAPATCQFAHALADRGLTADAVVAYEEVLRADPSSACALAGLDGLRPTSRPACQVAAELRQAGDAAAARTTLEGEIGRSGAECARRALTELGESSWTDRVQAATTWLAVTTPVVLVVLLLLLWPLAKVPPVGRWLRRRAPWRPQVLVGPFDDPGNDGLKPAHLVTALVGEQLAGPTDDELRSLSLSIVDTFQELDGALDALKDLDARLAPVSGFMRLLDAVVGPRRWGVTGALRVLGSGEPAVSAGLRDGAVLVEATTFGTQCPGAAAGPATPVAESFAGLAVPLAGWVRHHAAADLGGGPPLGTTAISYAWLCAGTDAQERDDSPAAAAYYRKALDADPRHDRAAVALALARAGTASPDDAVEILRQALDALDGRLDGTP